MPLSIETLYSEACQGATALFCGGKEHQNNHYRPKLCSPRCESLPYQGCTMASGLPH